MNILIYSSLLAFASFIVGSQIVGIESHEQFNTTINPVKQNVTMMDQVINNQFGLMMNMIVITSLMFLFICLPELRR